MKDKWIPLPKFGAAIILYRLIASFKKSMKKHTGKKVLINENFLTYFCCVIVFNLINIKSMNQISSLNSQLLSNKGPTSNVWESMDLDAMLRPSVAQKRKAVADLMSSVDLKEDINNTTMPFWIVPKIQKLGINGFQISEYGGPGFSNLESGAIYYEMSKVDASVATFVLVHNAIGNNVVDALGDSAQK